MIFIVDSGKLVVSDPCCEADGDGNNSFDVLNGKWEVSVYKNNWGVASIEARHEKAKGFFPKSANNCSVDSGQLGFFDMKKYDPNNDEWYDSCCDQTLSDKGYGLIDGGFITSTGGDGLFCCHYGVGEFGLVDRIEVVFQEEENEECEGW